MMDGNGQQQQPPQPSPHDQQLMALHSHIRSGVEVMVRGVIASSGGKPSPGALLTMIAWYVGNFSATVVRGDLDAMLKLRSGLQKAFQDGVAKAEIQPTADPIIRPDLPLRP